jgi:hypothetical protein
MLFLKKIIHHHHQVNLNDHKFLFVEHLLVNEDFQYVMIANEKFEHEMIVNENFEHEMMQMDDL